MEQDEWIPGRKAAGMLGMSQTNFLYYVRNEEIAIKPGTKERSRLYSHADTLKVQKRLQEKTKKPKPEKPLIDWVGASDVPIALLLSQQVYNEEVDLQEAALYASWRKNNDKITIGAFNQERSEVYATVQLVPLPEKIILDVLAGRREESSIAPDEIEGFDRPGAYTLLCTSVTALKSRPMLLTELLKRYIAFWLEQYPERYIHKIYAQTVSESGAMLAQHMFMAPRPDLAYNAFELNLLWPPASKLIRQFKAQMEEKAPLPDALCWPPAHLEEPIQAPTPARPRRIASPDQRSSWSQEKIDASTQPENTITLQDLADQLNIPRRSLLDHIQRRNLEHIALPHPSRAGEMKRYFTDEQAEAVRLALGK